jgi:hypothetical protein
MTEAGRGPGGSRLRRAIDSLQADSRRRKLERFLTLFRPTPESRFLEVGVGNHEPLPVTNFMVRNYPHRGRITALGLGDLSGFQALHPEVRTVSYEGGTFPFADGEFDIAHSNAVIEHVGSRDAQLHFLSEMARVARAGMVSTPNRFFPVETHTLIPLLHWLGKERFDRTLHRIGTARIDRLFRLLGKEFPAYELADLRLLGAGDLRSMAREAGLPRHRVFKNRLAGMTLTLSLVWWR